MIGNNISHDTIIKSQEYLGDSGAKLLKDMNIEYTDVTYDNYLTIQKEIGKSSWFGFGIVLKGKLKNKRDELIKLLNKKNIETRPIVAGNFLKNPVIKFINHRKSGKMKNAEYIHKNGFFVGNDHRDLSSQLKILKKTIEDFSQK